MKFAIAAKQQPQQQRQADPQAGKVDRSKHVPQMRVRQPCQKVGGADDTDPVLRRREAAPGQQRLPLAPALVKGAAVIPVIQE